MAEYRGIDKSIILSTINEALELLETYSPGPETQKRIDKLRAPDATGVSPLGAIANAKDDKELANAIGSSGATYLVNRLHSVLEFHALADTDGKGRGVLVALHKWGAIGGAMTMEYNALDGEADTFRAVNCARNTALTAKTLQDAADIMQHVSQDHGARGRAWQAMTDLVEMGVEGKTDAEMGKVFLKLDLHERYILTTILTKVSDLGSLKDLKVENAMGRFGVAIDEYTTGKVNHTDPAVKSVRDKVEEALSPFYDTDEVNMTGIGIIVSGDFEKGKSPLGIVFGSTRRAAEAVALALPDREVLDHTGKRVLPKPVLKAPKTGPKP
ncbi:MAG: hypothetical protein ACAH80_10365 [Alphaproteobacteria bacterium]